MAQTLARYHVVSLVEGIPVRVLPKNDHREMLTFLTDGAVCLGQSVADINGGAGGYFINSATVGAGFKVNTIGAVWAQCFGGPATLRITEETAMIVGWSG